MNRYNSVLEKSRMVYDDDAVAALFRQIGEAWIVLLQHHKFLHLSYQRSLTATLFAPGWGVICYRESLNFVLSRDTHRLLSGFLLLDLFYISLKAKMELTTCQIRSWVCLDTCQLYGVRHLRAFFWYRSKLSREGRISERVRETARHGRDRMNKYLTIG